MLNITICLDGKTIGCGYKYVIQQGCNAWTAYRTDKGFKRFMELYGLKINAEHTQLKDLRHIDKGRYITTTFHDKQVSDDNYFWSLSEIPEGATKFVGLCNGQYVDCYILDEGDKVSVYRPNPNAKEIYRPYDYMKMSNEIG